MSVNIGATIPDGSVVWTVGRKVTNAPNVIADCDSVMEGSIKQFASTTANIPASGAEGNLVTVGVASSKAQIAVTNDNNVYYRNYASSAWGAWKRLTTASEIVDSFSMGQKGYVKFGPSLGGLIVQWGTVSTGFVADSGGLGYKCVFGFPISFTSHFSLSVLGGGGAPYNNERNYYLANSTLGDAQVQTSFNGVFGYIAIGF